MLGLQAVPVWINLTANLGYSLLRTNVNDNISETSEQQEGDSPDKPIAFKNEHFINPASTVLLGLQRFPKCNGIASYRTIVWHQMNSLLHLAVHPMHYLIFAWI
jgi:hypothetical protein